MKKQLTRLSSCWSLAFLRFSLHKCLHIPCTLCELHGPSSTLFFSQCLSKSSLFSHTGLLPCWLIFWHRGTACSCAFKTFFLRNNQPSWTPLHFRTDSQGIFPTSVLNSSKSTLRIIKVAVLLNPLLTSLRILNSTISWSLYPRQLLATISPAVLLHFEQQV